MNRFISIFSILITVCIICVQGQFVNTGTSPWFTDYRQIKTDHFKLIYPSTFDSNAIRLANLLEVSYEYSIEPYKIKPKRLPVVIHNQTVLSNGYVTWAPKRMELFSTPPTTTFSQPWLNQLSLHETRHVVQLSQLNQGFTKLMYAPVGQIATGLSAAFLPLWFLEGDAVYSETVHSNNGRGRTAYFRKELKAIELELPKRYSYDKSYLGSYKDFVPDFYRYGYQMVSYAYMNNNFTWQKTIKNVGRRPFTIAPFYFGLKKSSGLSKVSLYNHAFDTLRNNWISTSENQYYDTNIWFDVDKKSYSSYNYPVPLNNANAVYALRTGLDDIARIVKIENNKEEVIYTPGIITRNYLAGCDRYLAWEEVIPDPRWEQRSYNVVKLLDVETNKQTTLLKKALHYSPEFSPDGKRIVVINQTIEHKNSVQIYQLSNKQLLSEIQPPHQLQLLHIDYSTDSTIYVVGLNSKGKSIWQVDIYSHQWKQIMEPVFHNITDLKANEDYLVYTSDYDGTENIYLYGIQSGESFKISNDQYGAVEPNFSNNYERLFYASYTSDGYRISSIDLTNTNTWINEDSVLKGSYYFADKLCHDSLSIGKDDIPCEEYPIEKYSKFLNGINVHSWLPFYVDIDDAMSSLNGELPVYPGATAFIQNNLSSVTGQVSYYMKDGYHH
ncbi:MAG: hypothetical protein MI922_10440, partial [Bacteroidales bacterium]|nr:hypothetical protein [Bacteroidales bacterium]